MDSSCMIVIPARLASTRLPEKLLRKAGGKSILHHTYLAANRTENAGKVVVAVDDVRLAEEVDSFGGQWVMTSVDCASGTDRIAEVATAYPDVENFVNVQGDEPEIEPSAIDAVASALINDPEVDMATAGTPIRELELLNDSSVVKIVMSSEGAGQGRAVYFSRSVVPHSRDGIDQDLLNQEPPIYWHHLGLYAYRRGFLEWFAKQKTGRLEQIERLEQLRAIEAGKRIDVVRVESATPGIDTVEDFEAFCSRLNAN